MTIKNRLGKLEDSTPDKHPCAGARELLEARIGKADTETRERLLTAISERVEHCD